MAPNNGMAIGEVQGKAVAVPMGGDGWKINPQPRQGISLEEAIVDAALIFLQHHPQLGRPPNVRVLDKNREVVGAGKRRRRAWRPGAHEAVHGITTHRGKGFPLNRYAFIRGTMVKGGVRVVTV